MQHSLPLELVFRQRIPTDAAYRIDVAPSKRRVARQQLFTLTRSAQWEIMRVIGNGRPPRRLPHMPMQTAAIKEPAFPPASTAAAVVGMTAWHTYMKSGGTGIVTACLLQSKRMRDLKDRHRYISSHCEEVVGCIAREVETRLTLHNLTTVSPHLASLEVFRVFLSFHEQQQSVRTVFDLIRVSILCRDLLSPLFPLRLHPDSLDIFVEIEGISKPYLASLRANEIPQHQREEFGIEWSYELAEALLPFIALLESRQHHAVADERQKGEVPEPQPSRIAPLNKKTPVCSDLEQPSTQRKAGDSSSEHAQVPTSESQDPDTHRSPDQGSILDAYSDALRRASECVLDEHGKPRRWSDVTPTSQHGGGDFNPLDTSVHINKLTIISEDVDVCSVLDGQYLDHCVPLGNQIAPHGTLHSRIMMREHYPELATSLNESATPIVQAFRRTLLRQSGLEYRGWQSRGSIDPSRLPFAGCTDTIFRRLSVTSTLPSTARHTMLLAADLSSSMRIRQVAALVTITAAWLHCATFIGKKTYCGMYNCGYSIEQKKIVPVVHWLMHPHIIPRSLQEAIRVLSGIDRSHGVNHDSLSLSYMIREALKNRAPSEYVHAYILTDAEWNHSLVYESGREEVRAMFQQLRKEAPLLRTTLIVLGDKQHEPPPGYGSLDGSDATTRHGMKDHVDMVIPIPTADLLDSQSIASIITQHMARSLRNAT